MQASACALLVPSGVQVVDAAFYKKGQLAVLLSSSAGTAEGQQETNSSRLVLVPTTELQYFQLPQLPSGGVSLLQVHA